LMYKIRHLDRNFFTLTYFNFVLFLPWRLEIGLEI
jgi:hypothetical protein